MPKKPEILETKIVAASRLFRVESVDLRFSNGEERQFERLAGGSGGAVIVVPLLDDDTVLLIREYGVGIEDYEIGLPKGKVDPGEDFIQAANRELKEEVGYGANQLDLLKSMSQSPAYMRHQTQIVVARDLYPERLQGDEPEPLEVISFKLSQLEQWLTRDDLTEARTIAALFLTRSWLESQNG